MIGNRKRSVFFHFAKLDLITSRVSESGGREGRERERENIRYSFWPRHRFTHKHVFRNILQRIIILDQRFRSRSNLDRFDMGGVSSRFVEV